MATTFPQRPARASSDVRQRIAPWTTHLIGMDMPIPNPWLAPEAIPRGCPIDEREWLRLERDPAVSGALRARKARLLSDGAVLEPGKGDGADELFEWWEGALEELPLMGILDQAFGAIPRGWKPFENVGADRVIAGKPSFAPIEVRDALSWQFQWTGGGDLIFCPGIAEARGYRMRSLPAMMKWWTPKAGSLTNPYGHPMHADYVSRQFAHSELAMAGMVQIKQAAGFLKISHPFLLANPSDDSDALKLSEVLSFFEEMKAILQASGMLLVPQDVAVEWVDLVEAIDKWISLLRWFDDVARGFYQGGNLSTMVSGATGSLAAGEVQERQGLSLAAVDASIIEHEFRAGWLRPWSARNAAIIAPAAFPGIGLSPRLEDVPLAAVPRIKFAALHKIRKEDMELLKLFTEIGIIDAEEAGEPQEGDASDGSDAKRRLARVDAQHHLRLARWRLIPEGEAGATLDTSRKETVAPQAPGEPVDETQDQEGDVAGGEPESPEDSDSDGA